MYVVACNQPPGIDLLKSNERSASLGSDVAQEPLEQCVHLRLLALLHQCVQVPLERLPIFNTHHQHESQQCSAKTRVHRAETVSQA